MMITMTMITTVLLSSLLAVCIMIIMIILIAKSAVAITLVIIVLYIRVVLLLIPRIALQASWLRGLRGEQKHDLWSGDSPAAPPRSNKTNTQRSSDAKAKNNIKETTYSPSPPQKRKQPTPTKTSPPDPKNQCVSAFFLYGSNPLKPVEAPWISIQPNWPGVGWCNRW